jgi:hypothetical protein
LFKTSYAAALLVLTVALSPLAAMARTQSSDQVHFGRDIYLESGDESGDLVCIVCSIHVRGQAGGDAVTVLGSITVENGQIAGDAVAVAGRLRLNGNSQVGGDAVSIIGGLERDSDAKVGGDMVSLGGVVWFFLIVVLPFVLLAAFVTLIVWLIQRLRQPAQTYSGVVQTPRL